MEERSAGIIFLRQHKGVWETLLIHQKNGGHWGFPKGHVEAGETLKQAAIRESLEECGLLVDVFLPIDPFVETYIFTKSGKEIHKTVTYFVAKSTGDIQLQQEEVLDFQWLELLKAREKVTYASIKNIITQLSTVV